MGNIGTIYCIFGFIITMIIVCTICVIMIYELIDNIKNDLFPNLFIDPMLLFLLTFMLYIPTALILNWKQMTFVSWIGIISVIAIFFSLIGLLIKSFYDFDFLPPPKQLLYSGINDINSQNLAMNASKSMSIGGQLTFSFSIFITGVAGNAAVPKVYTSLKNKNDIIVSLFYGVIACIAYWML